MASRSRTAKQTPKPKRKAPRKKTAPASRGLSVDDIAGPPTPEGRALADAITADGGRPLAIYRDPLGGHPVVLAALPLSIVEPTPYQRDLSEPHVKRLASAMERVDRFLDPLIAVRQDGKYWTPNGNHRLGASKLLGTQAIVALVLSDPDVAFQILALNTEKAHNLKERALEVIRMYRGMLGLKEGHEAVYGSLFEEPNLITLGFAYELRPRISGGAYNPILKRVDTFLAEPMEDAIAVREERAGLVLRLDDEVTRILDALKARGFTSPYLRYYVVARLNFLRFKKGPAEFDESFDRLIGAAGRFNVDRVRREDVQGMGRSPTESTDEEV